MAPSRILVLLVSLAALAVSSPLHRKPVKRDSPNLHIVEAPLSPHLETSSRHSDQESSQMHHLDQSSSQSHHLSEPSSQVHDLDHSSSQSHHLSQPSSQMHHLDQSSSQSHHLSQPSSQMHHFDHSSSQNHHLSQPSSQMHHLDQSSSQSHHLSQPSSQMHHFDHSSSQSHHLSQPTSQIHHLDQIQNGPVNSIHDHNEVHPQSKLEKKSRKGPKKGRKSNEDLLHHVGMTKLRSPTVNHHRKRLASQSRKTHGQKSTSDSKMFVIKLPPNPYYYAHHNLKGLDVMEPQPNSVNKVPVHFNTNGKPSRIYHWNIPVLKKMVARKVASAGKSAILADSDIFNIDKQVTWNETDDDKSVYRKAVFYGPKKQSKHTFRKYFAGNGKPHSFYVMDKNKTPSSIYRLLP